MYGAMREHAPSSTRLAGMVTTVAVTAGAAWLLAVGVGHVVGKPPMAPILFSVLPDEVVDVLPEPDQRLDMPNDETLTLVAPVRDVLVWVAEDPPVRGSTEPPRTGPGPDTGAATGPAPRAAVRIGAKLLPGAPPPYPAADIRRSNEGVSSLAVCLDVRGRVTSASLAKSSGHSSLDQAALKWVRDAKFSPAKVDGAPQAVCGHAVDYEWTLDRR